MQDATRHRLDTLILVGLVIALWAIIIVAALVVVSLSARTAHAQTVCCGPSGQLWPCQTGDAACAGPPPWGFSCTGSGVTITQASACGAATPTPGAPTPTPGAPAATPTPVPGAQYCHATTGCFALPMPPGVTCPAGSTINSTPCAVATPTPTAPPGMPTPTATPAPISGPVAIGFDPYQVTPCFGDALGAKVAYMGGAYLCPNTATKAWTIASSVEADPPVLPPGTSTWVPWGNANRITISRPGDYNTPWHASVQTNTIENPCPLTCNGWLWTTIQDSTLDDPGVPEYDVDSDLTYYLQASWKATTTTGKARLVAQFSFNLGDGSGWAELDVNLGMTPTWPRFTVGQPGYVWIAPVDAYKAGDGLRYYVVMDGPALGFTDAMSSDGMHDWRIPLSALVRKARADNPTAFPVTDDAQVSSFGVAWEQYGEVIEDIQVQALHLWAQGPQTLPAKP